MASWTDIPLDDVIRKSPVVVVGEVQRISPGPVGEYAFDTAFIRIERVLKSTGTNEIEKAGSELPLRMPSATNKTRESTDILYRKGQRGIWILKLNEGKYTATYPKDFQDLSQETKIVEIIGTQAAKPSE